ncbi:MAG: hypothetical protein H6R04_91 [Burkholderiaceae bacterium]|nr:hypothetical protein [Burkholderiaceae bacterium]
MNQPHIAPATGVASHERRGNLLCLSGITALHLCLLAAAVIGLGAPTPPIVAPRIIGMLVSDAPAADNSQSQPSARSEPAPVRTINKTSPLPAVSKAPPSERALTAPAAAAPAAASKGTAGTGSGPGAAGGGQVSLPRTDAAHLNNPKPVYPSVSRRMGEQGRVLLSVYILPDGSVGEIRLKQSCGHPRLDESAMTAVRRWRYVPARRGNEPIPYWYVQPISFSLDE